MALVEINPDTCIKCGACVAACGSTIIIPQENGLPCLYPGADPFCMHCGHCVAVCPTGSLIHRDMLPEQCLPLEDNMGLSFEQISRHIKARRSIREFQDKAVPRDLIEQVIETARYAPSGHNLQEVSWLVIDNQEDLRHLTAIGMDWARSMANTNTPGALEMQGILRMYDLGINLFLRDAPALVVAFAAGDNPIAPTDCAIALSTFDFTAQSAGLGCFWNGYFCMSARFFPPMVEVLALPEGCLPYGALGVGYPRFRYWRIPPRKPAHIVYHSQHQASASQ